MGVLRGVARSVLAAALAGAFAAVLLVAACANASTSPTSGGVSTVTPATGGGGSPVAIDPAGFSSAIDNLYLPLHRGASFVYEGGDEDGPTRDTVTVLFDTKVVMGVECRVVLDEVLVGGELRESTRDWYAQDSKGNVWYFGEDTKEYKDGGVTSTAGSWEAGVDGAVPGIVMEADPKVGDRYQQEYLAGEAEDMAEVLEVDASADVPYSSFSHVVKIKEWTPLEPGVVEEKYYAPGMGLVLVKQVEGGSDWEQLIDLYGF